MNRPYYINNRLMLLLTGLAVCASCYTSTYFNIRYHLPADSQTLQGRQLALVIEDGRDNKPLLTDRAAESLEFGGSFSLALLQAGEEETLLGVFDLPALFREAFARRCQALGIRVSGETTGDTRLRIRIEDFSLDRRGQRWISRIRYQAILSMHGTEMARQSVTGSAERFSWLGQPDAEKVMGEMFSDTVNDLQIEELFQQAGRKR